MVRFVNVNLSENNNLNFALKEDVFSCLPCGTEEEKNLFLQILTKITSTKGDILIGTESILRCKECRYRKKIKELGVVYRDYKFIGYKNVYENLAYYMEIRGYKWDEADKIIDETLEFFGMSEKKHSEIEELSHEGKVILGLARAMLTDPKYLILDDIHIGTKKSIWRKIFLFLQKLSRSKTGILYLTCDDEFVAENSKKLKNISGGTL